MNIIGVTGKAGSGKSEVANVLVKNHGFVAISLADPLKRACRDFFGFTDQQLWGPSEFRNAPDKRFSRKHSWVQADGIAQLEAFGGHEFKCICCGLDDSATDEEKETCYLTPRFALQQLGTEYGRAMYEDTWIRIAMRDAEFLLSGKEQTISPPNIPTYYPQTGAIWLSVCAERKFGQLGASETRWDPFDSRRLRRSHAKGVVISDVRFPNELAAIRAAGGRIWHRPGLGTISSTHASENSLDEDVECDARIPWQDEMPMLDRIVAMLLEMRVETKP